MSECPEIILFSWNDLGAQTINQHEARRRDLSAPLLSVLLNTLRFRLLSAGREPAKQIRTTSALRCSEILFLDVVEDKLEGSGLFTEVLNGD